MTLALKPHPATPCAAVTALAVDVARAGAALKFTYRVTGTIADLRLPPVVDRARADDLWRTTCFEAFVREASTYFELNFAPSTRWAAYRFAAYRQAMSIAREIEDPKIDVQSTPRSFALAAAIALPGLPPDAPWRLGLSAVIEETNGRLSYWALAHPQGKPDFHHEDCFALELGPASRA